MDYLIEFQEGYSTFDPNCFTKNIFRKYHNGLFIYSNHYGTYDSGCNYSDIDETVQISASVVIPGASNVPELRPNLVLSCRINYDQDGNETYFSEAYIDYFPEGGVSPGASNFLNFDNLAWYEGLAVSKFDNAESKYHRIKFSRERSGGSDGEEWQNYSLFYLPINTIFNSYLKNSDSFEISIKPYDSSNFNTSVIEYSFPLNNLAEKLSEKIYFKGMKTDYYNLFKKGLFLMNCFDDYNDYYFDDPKYIDDEMTNLGIRLFSYGSNLREFIGKYQHTSDTFIEANPYCLGSNCNSGKVLYVYNKYGVDIRFNNTESYFKFYEVADKSLADIIIHTEPLDYIEALGENVNCVLEESCTAAFKNIENNRYLINIYDPIPDSVTFRDWVLWYVTNENKDRGDDTRVRLDEFGYFLHKIGYRLDLSLFKGPYSYEVEEFLKWFVNN